MARRCVLAGWRPYDSRTIKRRNISSVNMVCQFTINFIFIVVIDDLNVYSGCHLISFLHSKTCKV